MLSINTNLSSLIAQRSMKQSTNSLNQAIERMTTGAKINYAKDNAANYNIATNMTTKLGALQVAEDNCAMGLDMLATANGTLDQIHDKLQRLRDLAVQASNGTYGSQSKQAINAEANALVDEIERLYNTAEYNGINLMKGQVTGSEESNFIKDIDRRDTSKMTTLASVDVSTKLNSGTYSISTPEELAKLATMTNNGLIGEDTEFVLGADIDLSGYANWTPIGESRSIEAIYESPDEPLFRAIFDGNGYHVINLTIECSTNFQGLFGVCNGAIIKNIALDGNANTVAQIHSVGMLVGAIWDSTIDNCYVQGDIYDSENCSAVGGLVGRSDRLTVLNSYSSVNIGGNSWCSGGLGGATYNIILRNCYVDGNIKVDWAGGGLLGEACNSFKIEDSFFAGTLNGVNKYNGGLVGLMSVEYSDSYMKNAYVVGDICNADSVFGRAYAPFKKNVSIINCGYSQEVEDLNLPLIYKKVSADNYNVDNLQIVTIDNVCRNSSASILNYSSALNIQVGVTSEVSSHIELNIEGIINGLSLLRTISSSSISNIDRLLSKVSTLQSKYGATENRLNSALEEISTQYENLVSSRSTLQDADIAEVSSEYIRQQILQQASATLLSTANQSASIALSLI